MIERLDKDILYSLYIKQGKSICEIAKMYGCSSTLVRYRYMKYGIPLRPTGAKRVDIDKSMLRRLYIQEGVRQR